MQSIIVKYHNVDTKKLDNLIRTNKEVIQNYNKMCLEKSNQIGKLFRYVKNLGKIILRKGVPDWTSVIHEVPIYPKMIYQHLTRLNIKYFKVFVKPNEIAVPIIKSTIGKIIL